MRQKYNLEDVTLLDFLYILSKKYGKRPALQIMDKEKTVVFTYDMLRERTVAVSSFLIEKNIPPKTHIAILTENRPEWAVIWLGIVSSGCVTVPIDIKLSLQEIKFIINDSDSKVLFVSGKFLEEILSIKDQLPNIELIISLDKKDKDGIIYLDDLKYDPNKIANRPDVVDPNDLAFIVYTSGTTGVAKGVMLTYKNLLFEAMSLYGLIKFNQNDSFVSILPLNHTLEITGGLIAPLYGGACVTYATSLKGPYIIDLMRRTKSTGMIAVPLVLKMLLNGILKEVSRQSKFKQYLFYKFLGLSRWLLRFNIKVGKILFSNLHSKFGKRFKYFVCGGAPLDIELEKDFQSLGFKILQGYGLTETAPVISVNTLKNHRYGSVGKVLDGVEVKIVKDNPDDKEGEIVVRGPNVMLGYYKNPEKTAEVLKDGWFYTGDLGYFDEDGFLYISGRAKNLIVLGQGKKVFPEEVEEVMSKSPYISEICVLGKVLDKDKKEGEEVCAIIIPNLEKFPEKEGTDKEKIKEVISQEIRRLSKDLAEYKKIVKFILYFEELPKTSTRKIKRKEVSKLWDTINEDKRN